MKAVVTFGIAAGLGYLLYRSTKQLQSIQFSSLDGDIDRGNTNMSKTTVKMQVELYNPNTKDIPFNSFFADIYYNDDRITSINVKPKNSIILKKRATTNIPFTFSFSNLKLANTFLEIISDIIDQEKEKTKMLIKVDGQLKADIFTIPISETIDIAKKL